MEQTQSDLERSAATLREAIDEAGSGLVERQVLVEMIALSAIASEHVLVLGPPGTAKSEAVRRMAATLGGRYFEYLLGRFTEPNELFGPIDLSKLAEGVIETRTERMLPEAEIAFLDEVFLGSTAILNTLLNILNERQFQRGHTRIHCPLRVCVGAANRLPVDETLAAFADRFLVHLFVHPIPDPQLEDLLERGWSLDHSRPALATGDQQPAQRKLSDLDRLASACEQQDLSQIRGDLAFAIRELRRAGIYLSDRRVVKSQRLIAAASTLAGRQKAMRADLWPLIFAIPTAEQQETAREVLADLLQAAENQALNAAVLEASASPRARARKILEIAASLFKERPNNGAGDALRAWQLRLEGIAREIDSGFGPGDLTGDLKSLRERIVSELETNVE